MDDGRTTDRRTTEHGYTISSPCEPDGSGELKRSVLSSILKYMENASENFNKENPKGTRKNIIMLNLLTSTHINNFIKFVDQHTYK